MLAAQLLFAAFCVWGLMDCSRQKGSKGLTGRKEANMTYKITIASIISIASIAKKDCPIFTDRAITDLFNNLHIMLNTYVYAGRNLNSDLHKG